MTLQATVACEVNSYRIPVRFHLPNPNDHIQRIILQSRAFYERAMLEDIGSSLPENAFVVDVGANIGNHTLFFSAVVGARTLAIEPNAEALRILRANISLNGLQDRVDVKPIALGAEAGMGDVVEEDPSKLGMARVRLAADGQVPVARLDDVVREQHVDLIKIDVEGMETEVLRGAMGTMVRCRPRLLVEAATAQALRDVEAILRPIGYRKIKVYNETPTYLFEMKFADLDPDNRIQAIEPAHIAALPPTKAIVAGMATVAGNEIALRAAVMSLLPQVDRLYVYLNGFTEAPRFIAEHQKIRHFIDTDGSRYGDAGKFWGLEQVEDAIYVTCDDDIIYPDDFVARMIGELAQLRGRAVVSVHGSIILQPSRGYYKDRGRAVFHYERSLMRRRRVHVAATGTSAFHSSLVKMKLADFRHRNMADIWLAEYLYRQSIPAYAVPRKDGWLQTIDVPRSSIYAQSAAGTGSSYDSSTKQDEVLSSIYPLSLLGSDAADSSSIIYLVDTDRPDGLVEFILAVAGRERDPTIFVTCDHETEDMRGVALHPDFLCEVHLVARSGRKTSSYLELLSKNAQRVRGWTIRNGNELKPAAGNEWEKWFEPIEPHAS
ncbi:FkbM family methyltransferase [Rhizobium mayense]|uniref:FkbM family methyltransferase n=1 Tax=Rhizobium mayense TaxID=1312184 RepID=A0ABT7JMW2_9HYPH|nr:FkbM family methyltransferase [Rhizobium mayense]MDL2397689.1 FkbM family methyltransferase [Rhizobium mayense]